MLHAVCDALLGAAGLDDIGERFPDTDPGYKDADSAGLLRKVYGLVKRKGYIVANIDTVVIAEKPKLSPFKKDIRQRIAKILNIEKDKIGVKAKTNERLGAIGGGGAIAAYAVALLARGIRGKT